MATYERRIDALGGSNSQQSDDWNAGYTQALSDAMKIADDADGTIAELIEAIEAITDPTGRRSLLSLIARAEAVVSRISRWIAA